jgi:hypothetical protein
MNKKLTKACLGYTEATGGMNLAAFKRELKKKYPSKTSIINAKNRKELEVYCKRVKEIKEDIQKGKDKYFIKNTPLSGQHKKYCRCVAEVSAKNTRECLKSGDWKKAPQPGKKCLNPYSICTKSTKRRGAIKCTPYYNLSSMPANEIRALAMMKGMTVKEFREFVKNERR